MALDDNSIQSLAGLAGIEVEDLKNAISSEKETTIEIADGRKSYLPEELKTINENYVNEVKPNIISANLEAEAKRFAKDLGLELNGEGKRDFKTVFDAYKEKLTKESGLKPSEITAKYESQIKEKDALIISEREKAQQAVDQLNAFKFKTTNDFQISANLGDSDSLSKEDRVTLFNARYQIDKDLESGVLHIKDRATNEIIKNDLKSPESLVNIVKEFDKKYISKPQGRGGEANTGGSSAGTPEEIKKTLTGLGLKPGSKEYYTKYNELLNNK